MKPRSTSARLCSEVTSSQGISNLVAWLERVQQGPAQRRGTHLEPSLEEQGPQMPHSAAEGNG
jgi:hypothetical protein